MAAFSAGPWIIFLVVGVSYADSECRDKSEDISYGSYTLQNEQVIWWCKNNSQAFPEGNRFHISTCPNRRHIQDTQLCETRSNAMEECGNSTNPANAVQVLKSDLPPYVKYFVCEEGMEWDSGSPGQVTQCLDGRWTEIADSCVEESTIPRDCSMIAKMKKGNWAKSGIREITPSGRREDDAIPVYCGLSKRNHAINGWTRFLTYHARNPLPSHNGSGNPDSGDFFIGIQHLSALSWDGTKTRPLVITFSLTGESQKYQFATFDDVLIEREPPYRLLQVGNYHGNSNNALKGSEGQNFAAGEMGFWWNQTNDDFSITPSGIKWGSIQSIYRIEGFVTPKDFDREHSCPPAIGYDTSWNESTEVAMTFHRVEGSTVEYHCNEPYKIEGMDQETFEGEAVCRRATAGGELTWSKIPKLPCRLICREGYSPNGDGKECLRFSNERAQFGLSSASLKCSRDGASLARITSIKDMESAHEGRTYYTAHVRVGNETVFEGPPAGEVSCDAASSCQADNVSRCLTVTKVSSSVSTQKFGNCEDANYYACSLPGRCPKGFFQHRGLCYRLLSLHSRLNFLRALEKCGEIGSGLVYPETKEDLDFVKNLTLNRAAVSRSEAEEVPVILGLNYAKRNWNGGWDYQPDAIIKSMAKEPGQMGSYRYAAVLKNAVNDIVIKSATMRWEEFNTTKYAACQLYGPTRCVQNAPPASENMMRVWDGAMHLRAVITYRCYPGYFMDGSVTLTQQEFSCRGQLGGWVSAHYELFSCNILKVCSNESIQLSRGNMIVVTSSPNFLALNSTVTYICPPSMSMGKGVTAMNSTCVENSSEGQPGPPTFSFQPDDIPNCNVCIDDPNIANAISSWDRNTGYVINDRINLTCTSGFFFNDTADANTVKEILCTELGWFPGATDLMCRPGCTDPLPSAGPNMSIPELPQRDLGTELTYTCDQGLFVPAALPDAKSSVIITCLENSTWGMEPFKADDLHCVRMCMEKPVSPPAPGNTTWDRTPSQVGAKINLTCPAGYAFPNFSITIQLTCEEGGTWSEVGSREIFCRSYTNELPLAPTGTKYDGPPPPYWEGVVLNFTCAEGLVSKGELNTTSTTFNGTDWVPLELEFACFNVSKLEKKKLKLQKLHDDHFTDNEFKGDVIYLLEVINEFSNSRHFSSLEPCFGLLVMVSFSLCL